MSKSVLKAARIYYDEFDLTSEHNQLKLDLSNDAKDKTVFGENSRGRASGINAFDIEHSGFFDAGSGLVDTVVSPSLGVANKLISLCPDGVTAGDISYFSQGVSLKYEMAGEVGDMFAFAAASHSEGIPIIRGTILASGNKAADANGTAYEVGAATATQYLYAAIHCTSFTGTSIDVKIQSDSAEAFDASPSDRITFTQLTAVGSEFATRVSGAITDTWWRAVWNVEGGAPHASTILVEMGILTAF